MKTIAIIFGIWNISVFLLYGYDKLQAKRGRRRVSEFALLLCAFLMGSAGALIGMELFRHKTQHMKFKLLVPVFFILNVALLFYLSRHTA